jgi:hypothetical protein
VLKGCRFKSPLSSVWPLVGCYEREGTVTVSPSVATYDLDVSSLFTGYFTVMPLLSYSTALFFHFLPACMHWANSWVTANTISCLLLSVLDTRLRDATFSRTHPSQIHPGTFINVATLWKDSRQFSGDFSSYCQVTALECLRNENLIFTWEVGRAPFPRALCLASITILYICSEIILICNVMNNF